MREWFTIGAKLLGIYFLYSALIEIVQTITYLAWRTNEPVRMIMMLSSVVIFFLLTGFSLLLLFKTDWLANKINLAGDISQSSVSSHGYGLQTGIVLVGIYIFVTHIGRLIKVVVQLIKARRVYNTMAATQPMGLPWSEDMIVPGITIILSLFLIFGARQLTQWLNKSIGERLEI